MGHRFIELIENFFLNELCEFFFFFKGERGGAGQRGAQGIPGAQVS